MERKYTKTVKYIKADENKIINLSCIKWVKKLDECMDICTKGDGCYVGDTHKLCRINNPASFDKLNKYFE